MSDITKSLVSKGLQPEAGKETAAKTFNLESAISEIKAVSKTNIFRLRADEYWIGWGVVLNENYFIRLFLNQESIQTIDDAQVALHFAEIGKYFDQLEDLNRAGLFNQDHYPGLLLTEARKKLEEAFEQLKSKSGRETYLLLLNKNRVHKGKEKTAPMIYKALEDEQLEESEEKIILELGRSNGLTYEEIKQQIDEILASNPQFKRVTVARVLEDKVKTAVVDEMKAMQQKSDPAGKISYAWVIGIVVVIIAIIYISMGKEGRAWEAAVKENTETSYAEYLAAYPDGDHKVEAMRFGDALRIEAKQHVVQSSSAGNRSISTHTEPRSNEVAKDAELVTETKRQPIELENSFVNEHSIVMNMVENWIAMTNNKDRSIANLYAPVIEKYYLQRNVSKNFVLNNKIEFFNNWDEIQLSIHDVSFESDGNGNCTVVYEKRYFCSNFDNGKELSGKIFSKLRFAKHGSGYKIIAETDFKKRPSI